MRTVAVRGEGFPPYEVRIGRGLLERAGPMVADLGLLRVAVVADAAVADSHGARLAASLAAAGVAVEWISVPSGEASKSFAGLERLLDQMLALGLDRSCGVAAVGGGVVGDLAGLAAALYMRGLPVIQVPTSLLAQVDASVGGKTAIDTPRGKNLVGAFHHPRLVLADIDALATLPERQLRSGWAEVLKHGLIADAAYFDACVTAAPRALAGEAEALEAAVARSVEIKAGVVGDDPREAGRRALLNLGHTFGHAIEAELGFDKAVLTHGEAVAIGCVLAFRLSAEMGLCDAADAGAAEAGFAAAGLPVRIDPAWGLDPAALIGRMAGDKKAEGGRLTLVLARGIGDAVVVRDVDEGVVRAVLTA